MDKIRDLIHSIAAENTADSMDLFKDIISDKVSAALADKQVEVAQGLFGESVEEEFDYDSFIDSMTEEEATEFVEYVMESEGVESLDEISKQTLGSYIKKASHDVATKSAAVGRYADREHNAQDSGDYQSMRKNRAVADKMFKKSWNRRKGMEKATDRLTKEDVENLEEVEVDTIIDEETKTEYAKVPKGQRPKGIGWELHQAGEQTGKDHSVYKRKVKFIDEETKTEYAKVPKGQRPKGIGWELHQAGEQTGKDHSVYKRKVK